MASSEGTLSPRQRVIRAALEGGQLTNEELGEAFGVGARTIGSEIAAIRAAGFHVSERSGRPRRGNSENSEAETRKLGSGNPEIALARDFIEEEAAKKEAATTYVVNSLDDHNLEAIKQLVIEYASQHGWDKSTHDDIVASLVARIHASPEPITNPAAYVVSGSPCAIVEAGQRFHTGFLRTHGGLIDDPHLPPSFPMPEGLDEDERIELARRVWYARSDAEHDEGTIGRSLSEAIAYQRAQGFLKSADWLQSIYTAHYVLAVVEAELDAIAESYWPERCDRYGWGEPPLGGKLVGYTPREQDAA